MFTHDEAKKLQDALEDLRSIGETLQYDDMPLTAENIRGRVGTIREVTSRLIPPPPKDTWTITYTDHKGAVWSERWDYSPEDRVRTLLTNDIKNISIRKVPA